MSKRAGRQQLPEQLEVSIWHSNDQPAQDAWSEIVPNEGSGVICQTLGIEILRDIVEQYLCLLNTFGAVYERDGKLAYGKYVSPWCRFLNKGAPYFDGKDASGSLYCQQSCLEISKIAIETGRPADLPCAGGINSYACPITAGEQIIGSVSVSYGAPPSDDQTLAEIARNCGASTVQLQQLSELYPVRSETLIKQTIQCVTSCARLIGKIVQQRLNDECSKKRLSMLNADLLEQCQHAQDAYKLMSKLVADMGNEISNPINGIISISRMLQRTNLDDRQMAFVNAMTGAGASLLAIASDFLDVSKMEETKQAQEETEFDLAQLVRSICEQFSTEATSRQVSLRTIIDPLIPLHVWGNPEWIHQVLSNLVSNAITCSQSAEIVIRVAVKSIGNSSTTVLFFVGDHSTQMNGEGRQFVEASDSISKAVGDSRLELSLCKWLVELMGGQIGCEGSSFWFTVPLERAKEAVLSGHNDLSGMRVLIADARPNSRRLINTYIREAQMEPVVASTAQEATRLLRHAYMDGNEWGCPVFS